MQFNKTKFINYQKKFRKKKNIDLFKYHDI